MRYRISNHLLAMLRVLLGTLLGVCVSTASLADEDHDRARKALLTDRGEVPYARLVLALGADPIRLTLARNAADAVLQPRGAGQPPTPSRHCDVLGCCRASSVF